MLPDSETAQYWSSIATLVGVPLSLLALGYAARQFELSRRAGSGATLLTLTDSFRTNWKLYLEAQSKESNAFAFADLANVLEAACSIHRDQVLYGHSKKVLEAYLIGVFHLLQENEQARDNFSKLLQTRETFENIREFIRLHKPAINSIAWKTS